MKYKKSNVRAYFDTWEVGEVYYREGGTQPFVITELEPSYYNTELEPSYYNNVRVYKCDYLNGTKKIVDAKEYLILAEPVVEEEKNYGKHTISGKRHSNICNLPCH